MMTELVALCKAGQGWEGGGDTSWKVAATMQAGEAVGSSQLTQEVPWEVGCSGKKQLGNSHVCIFLTACLKPSHFIL